MKRLITSLFLSCIVATSIFATGTSKPVAITFYHTSDFHENSFGLARIAKFVNDKRDEGENILFFDTGDWFNKGDLTPLETRGEAMLEIMGACKYDAVVPGNHDYFYGTARLAELATKYSIPILTANWPAQKYPSYRIHTFEGVRVGVIGIATLISNYVCDDDIQIQNIEAAVKATVAELETKTDIIVLLTHVGRGLDLKLAKENPRLDVIFGGHNHSLYTNLTLEEKPETLIRHSGSHGRSLGEVTLTWDGEKISDTQTRIIKISEKMEQSEEVKAIVDKYVKQ